MTQEGPEIFQRLDLALELPDPFAELRDPVVLVGLRAAVSGEGAPAHLLVPLCPPPGRRVLDSELPRKVDGPHLSAESHLCRRDLELPAVAFSLLGRMEHLSPLTRRPGNLTLSRTSATRLSRIRPSAPTMKTKPERSTPNPATALPFRPRPRRRKPDGKNIASDLESTEVDLECNGPSLILISKRRMRQLRSPPLQCPVAFLLKLHVIKKPPLPVSELPPISWT